MTERTEEHHSLLLAPTNWEQQLWKGLDSLFIMHLYTDQCERGVLLLKVLSE